MSGGVDGGHAGWGPRDHHLLQLPGKVTLPAPAGSTAEAGKKTFQQEIACTSDPSQSALTHVAQPGPPEKGDRAGAGPSAPERPHPGCHHPWDQGPPLQLTLGLSSTSRPGGLRGLLGPKHLLGAARGRRLSRSPRDPPPQLPASPQHGPKGPSWPS